MKSRLGCSGMGCRMAPSTMIRCFGVASTDRPCNTDSRLDLSTGLCEISVPEGGPHKRFLLVPTSDFTIKNLSRRYVTL